MKRVICASDNYSIEDKLYNDLQYESTRIGQKAFDVLDRQDIAGIITDGKYFWFESWDNDCPQSVYDYLKRYIKRKYGLEYLYDAT